MSRRVERGQIDRFRPNGSRAGVGSGTWKLVQILTKFHREFVAPDVQRIVDGLRGEMNARFDEVNGRFDAIYQRFDRLETEYHIVVAGLMRVEERLDRVEARL